MFNKYLLFSLISLKPKLNFLTVPRTGANSSKTLQEPVKSGQRDNARFVFDKLHPTLIVTLRCYLLLVQDLFEQSRGAGDSLTFVLCVVPKLHGKAKP